MGKKLITLEENDSLRSVHVYNHNEPRLNGIACPECGEELLDSNPMITLTSYPAKKNINCSKCDYVGYRIA